MRVGLLIYGSLDTVSGGYLYDRKLVEHLQRQGDPVEVISLPWRNYARHLSDNLSPAWFERLKHASLDILLQDELNHPSLFWLNRRLRRHIRYPLVSIVHHLRTSELRPAWQKRLYRLVERSYLQSVDGFIFNSRTTCQAVAATLGAKSLPPHRIAYPAGDQFQPQINAEEIAARALQPGPLRLLFLGNLIPRKGLHTLIDALRRLPPETCTLNVAGSLDVDPHYVRQVRRQIDADRLGDRVRLYGSLDQAELAGLLRSSHLLIVPSTYEGFGIVYLEGMSFGLPGIATHSGAASEIISDGQDGYLLPAGNPAVLADRLAGLAGDRKRLLAMSLTAHRRFLAHPTWEQSAGQIRKFLLEIV